MNVDEFMPNGDPDFADLIARIPKDWGKWIDCGPGWKRLLLELNEAIKAIDPDYVLHQCKEKFGGLRYYIEHKCNDICGNTYKQFEDDKHMYWPYCNVSRLVDWAEARSFKICENCGDFGEVRNHAWIRTLCDSCEKERKTK